MTAADEPVLSPRRPIDAQGAAPVWIDATRESYDAVADEYVRRIYGELEHKPFDRELLTRFADRMRGAGEVCDLGCGPGHVARFLHERGVSVRGVDLSPAMVERARALNPGIEFAVGDLTALDVPRGAWAGIVAFYSLIHVPRGEMTGALRGLRRTLAPGGLLLAAFHLGDETLHLDEWWDRRVSVDFHFFGAAEMIRFLEEAGFELLECAERDPYTQVEHPSRRAYLLAGNPRSAS